VSDTSAPTRADRTPAPPSTQPDAAPGPDRADHHGGSSMDRLARRVLLLKDAEPRALMDLQGSLVLSAVRCIISYVAIPIMLPVVAWAGVVATPLALLLAVVAIGMAVRSLRRVWQANWAHRWPYTAFIVVVIGLLAVSIVVDVTSLVA
jgi:hypothetical protein